METRRTHPFSARKEIPRPMRKESEPAIAEPEHVPGMAKLCEYFRRTKRGELCATLEKYDQRKRRRPEYPWAAENALAEDLVRERAKGEAADAERVNELRSLLYASSWQAAEQAPDQKRLLDAVPTLKLAIVEKELRLRETERYEPVDPEDERAVETLREHVETIARAIRERPCDQAAEPAARAIEAFTNEASNELKSLMSMARASWEDASAWERSGGKIPSPVHRRIVELRQRLRAWRPIRNYLYYYRAYKRWCEISHQ